MRTDKKIDQGQKRDYEDYLQEFVVNVLRVTQKQFLLKYHKYHNISSSEILKNARQNADYFYNLQ